MSMEEKPSIRLHHPANTDSLLTGGDGATRQQSAMKADDVLNAMDVVADSLGVERRNWLLIAVALAIRGGYVLVEKETGPIARWNDALYAALWLDVKVHCARHGVKVKPCVESKAFQDAWCERSGEADTTETLRRKFYDAPKRSAMVDAIVKLEQQSGAALPVERMSGLADFMHSQAPVIREGRSAMRRMAQAIQPQE